MRPLLLSIEQFRQACAWCNSKRESSVQMLEYEGEDRQKLQVSPINLSRNNLTTSCQVVVCTG
jgi:hypothetical protein